MSEPVYKRNPPYTLEDLRVYPKYSSFSCAACGGEDVLSKYIKTDRDATLPAIPCMLRTCDTCGFDWYERPLHVSVEDINKRIDERDAQKI